MKIESLYKLLRIRIDRHNKIHPLLRSEGKEAVLKTSLFFSCAFLAFRRPVHILRYGLRVNGNLSVSPLYLIHEVAIHHRKESAITKLLIHSPTGKALRQRINKKSHCRRY